MAISSPGLYPALADGFENDFDRFDVRLQRRRESAFVTDGGVVAALLQHALQRVKDFDAPAQGFVKTTRRPRA